MDRDIRKEITTLLWFRLSETLNNDPLTVDIDGLISGGMEHYLQKVKLGIGAQNDKVAASMMIKRYAFLSAMALFTMSHYDRGLNVQTSNLILVSHFDDEHWLPKFYFKDLTFEAVSDNREQWRERYVENIFANHISILVDQLSKITKISKLILWENVAVYLFWLYENVLNDNDERKHLIESDFRYVIQEAPGYVFGTYNHNPLSKFDSDKIYHAATDKYIRPRKTCCYSYQVKGSNKRCITCPCFQVDEEGRCQSEQSFCTTIRSVNE
ncbi:IucA/IucC family C-terminal-domain containing protein [Bacillus sp. CGMCC 1.16607]|uniref:IucA/IucC family C-terminal-domain containing protein n=1 Tax=Bacillus sp. CGMCC 1.16607 TaxID=3351842 RepID=UPI003634F8CC